MIAGKRSSRAASTILLSRRSPRMQLSEPLRSISVDSVIRRKMRSGIVAAGGIALLASAISTVTVKGTDLEARGLTVAAAEAGDAVAVRKSMPTRLTGARPSPSANATIASRPWRRVSCLRDGHPLPRAATESATETTAGTTIAPLVPVAMTMATTTEIGAIERMSANGSSDAVLVRMMSSPMGTSGRQLLVVAERTMTMAAATPETRRYGGSTHVITIHCLDVDSHMQRLRREKTPVERERTPNRETRSKNKTPPPPPPPAAAAAAAKTKTEGKEEDGVHSGSEEGEIEED